jgi:hypothetical protein
MRRTRFVLVGLFVTALAADAAAKPRREPPIVPPPEAVDISKVKDKMQVFHDGKGHYIVVVSPKVLKLGKAKQHTFYGDGKVFYRQPVQSAGRNGDDFSYSIYDPRTLYLANSAFDVRRGKPRYICDKRRTPFERLPADKAAAMLGQAKFFDVFWTRVPHALARDDRGTYYYVDRLAEDEQRGLGKRGFRVFRGMRGGMRRLRMKNVVSDVKGEVFTTNRGKLRLIVEREGRKETNAQWIAGKRRVQLTPVPVGSPQTRMMIYRELGVYTGIRLQRPCDDL